MRRVLLIFSFERSPSLPSRLQLLNDKHDGVETEMFLDDKVDTNFQN